MMNRILRSTLIIISAFVSMTIGAVAVANPNLILAYQSIENGEYADARRAYTEIIAVSSDDAQVLRSAREGAIFSLTAEILELREEFDRDGSIVTRKKIELKLKVAAAFFENIDKTELSELMRYLKFVLENEDLRETPDRVDGVSAMYLVLWQDLPESAAKPATATPASVFNEINQTFYVSSTVNIRSGPGTQFDVVNTVEVGTPIDSELRVILGNGQRWIKLAQTEEYISERYLLTRAAFEAFKAATFPPPKPATLPTRTRATTTQVPQTEQKTEPTAAQRPCFGKSEILRVQIKNSIDVYGDFALTQRYVTYKGPRLLGNVVGLVNGVFVIKRESNGDVLCLYAKADRSKLKW